MQVCEQTQIPYKSPKVLGARLKIYNQISNEKRAKIIKLVIEENKLLKEAAAMLKVNYSTAKTIMRIYRKENRILRKSEKSSKIFLITKTHKNPMKDRKLNPSFLNHYQMNYDYPHYNKDKQYSNINFGISQQGVTSNVNFNCLDSITGHNERKSDFTPYKQNQSVQNSSFEPILYKPEFMNNFIHRVSTSSQSMQGSNMQEAAFSNALYSSVGALNCMKNTIASEIQLHSEFIKQILNIINNLN